MIYIRFIQAILVAILFISCSDNDKQTVKKDFDTVKTTVTKELDTLKNKIIPGDTIFKTAVIKEVVTPKTVSEDFHDNLEDVFTQYVKIKDELATNDSVDSKKHAVEMLEVVSKVAEDAGKEIDKSWNIEGSKIMKYQSVIESTNTLAEQREWFNKLTIVLTEVIQKYGLPGKTVYELETRGSSGGKSSKWLTDSKDSDNPYSGKDENKDQVKVIRGWEFIKN